MTGLLIAAAIVCGCGAVYLAMYIGVCHELKKRLPNIQKNDYIKKEHTK